MIFFAELRDEPSSMLIGEPNFTVIQFYGDPKISSEVAEPQFLLQKKNGRENSRPFK